MLAFFSVLHVLLCIFMMFVILLQPGKDAGMGAALGGGAATSAFGGRGAVTFLSKVTAVSAIAFFLTSLGLSFVGLRQSVVPADEPAPPTAPAKPAEPAKPGAAPTGAAPTGAAPSAIPPVDFAPAGTPAEPGSAPAAPLQPTSVGTNAADPKPAAPPAEKPSGADAVPADKLPPAH